MAEIIFKYLSCGANIRRVNYMTFIKKFMLFWPPNKDNDDYIDQQ